MRSTSLPISFVLLSSLVFWILPAQVQAQAPLKYQEPPKGLVELVDTRPTPTVDVSPKDKAGRQWLLIEPISGLPPISDLAQPELRLAGLRMNPRTNGPSRGRYFTALRLEELPDGKEKDVTGLPAMAKIRYAGWAPDARHVYFVNADDDGKDPGLSLWIVDVATAAARRIPGVALNGVFNGSPCEWTSQSDSLVCKAIVKTRGAAPKRNEVPTGPVVQENLGRVTPGPTYEDLLKSPADEMVFDYYAMAQVEVVHLDGKISDVGKPGVIESASPSPDGNYVLVDERHHPYIYTLPFYFFPERVTVINLATGTAKQLVDKPLEDTIPTVRDAVAPGPREFEWRSDAAATVFWTEAGDGGDPRKEAAVRDTLFLQDAPFDGTPRKLAELPVRFRDVSWSTGKLALVEEQRWKDRKRIVLAVGPDDGAVVKLFEGSFEDRYGDPGRPFEVMNADGKDRSEEHSSE